MFSLFGARFAAVRSAYERHCHIQFRACAIAIATAAPLAGCMPATVPVASADPAARVAAVRYQSTTAPYTSLRPVTAVPWRERNDSVTPRTPDR
jgi:hypothetical protein